MTAVEPPASFAGLHEGDLIVEVNRKAVESVADLRREIQDGPRNVLVAVRRGSGTLFVAIPRDPSGGGKKGDSY